ncbi:Uncharacterised protein [Arcanobacterium haemolyticum]|nr:Uncharacterised protein [Arcanobacterium haemolyticum]
MDQMVLKTQQWLNTTYKTKTGFGSREWSNRMGHAHASRIVGRTESAKPIRAVTCMALSKEPCGYLHSHFDTNLVWGQLCSVGGVFLVGRHKSLGVISLRNNAQTRVSRWLLLLLRELNR